LQDGGTLVPLGDELQAIADRAVGKGLAKLAVEQGGYEMSEGIRKAAAFGEGTQEERGGGETAERVEVVQVESGGGSEGEEAGSNFEDAKFVRGILDFTGEDGFQSRATAEVNTEGGSVGQRGIEKYGGRFLLAGEVGFGALFGEVREGGSMGANKVEGGGTADLVEGLAEKLFFPVDIGCLQEMEELPLFRPSGTDLGKSVHRIAAYFFRGILEKGEEPFADGQLEFGLVGLRKASTDSTDNGDPAGFLLWRGLVEARDFLLPKFEPRQGAEFSIEVFRGIGLLFGHKEGSV
jgi:hypothetical protein